MALRQRIDAPEVEHGHSAVTFVRGDEQIETTWDRVFAAEEMYEALAGLIALNRSPGPSPVGEVVKRLDAAEAALAKARGET